MADILTPENIRAVYGVDSAIRADAFTHALQVSLRLAPRERAAAAP